MASIIHNSDRLNAFHLYQERNEMFILITLIQYYTEHSYQAISQENKLRGLQIGKADVKLYAFTDNIVLHTENPKESTNKQKISARLWNLKKSI